MARIFFILASIAVTLLVANMVLGFLIGDFNGQSQQRREAYHRLHELERSSTASDDQLVQERARFAADGEAFQVLNHRKVLHFLFGLSAALITVLVNCITVTYFIGTSRWCREVVDRYGLESALADRSTQLKRKTFPWALLGITTLMAIVILGVLSDPGAWPFERSASWVVPHRIAALFGTAVIAWSFMVQVGNIGLNYEVIEEILAHVRRIRLEKGLDVDDGPGPGGAAARQTISSHGS